MMSENIGFFWSDKWSMEEDTAWFVPGNMNVLCMLDLNSNYYKIVAEFPDYLGRGFRLNPNCIKCDSLIFCMPNYGKYIWCYDLIRNNFTKIEIENPCQVSIGIGDFWEDGGLLWAVSTGLKQIIKIDIKKKRVLEYYNITNCKNEEIAKSIKQEEYIYITSALKGRVYEFNIKTKDIKINEFPMIKNGLRTISVNKGKFWLSGYKKEIYIWEKESNEMKELDQFPADFGMYNFENREKLILDYGMTENDRFIFLESINVGNYIWFIPFQTNQILYIDKDTDEINKFEIEEEEEDVESIRSREMSCKYIIQYVYKNRYIGLYSVKNEIIVEIDVETLKMKKRIITIDANSIGKRFSGWIFSESLSRERELYSELIERGMENKVTEKAVGAKIYACVCGKNDI